MFCRGNGSHGVHGRGSMKVRGRGREGEGSSIGEGRVGGEEEGIGNHRGSSRGSFIFILDTFRGKI